MAPTSFSIAAAYRQISAEAAGEVMREIDDPHTGDQWILTRDPIHPEGPGRLMLVNGPGIRPAGAGNGVERQGRPPVAHLMPNRPVIHAGDALILEEDTPALEARLEAVALGAAVQGAVFKARLKIGGRVVRAMAISAGHAAFALEDEAQP